MRAIRVQPSSPGPDDAANWLQALADALDGSGPALLPLPVEPVSVRESLLAALQPDVADEISDLALLVPTSGSTGEPKGVLLSAAAIRASAAATHRRLGGPGQWVLALPLTHIAGLMVLARCLDAGRSPSVVDVRGGFTAQAFLAAAGESVGAGPVYTALVPTQLLRLLDAGVELTRFDAILLGGAAAPESLLARARATGARIVTTYGMSETCGGCVYDGRPLDDVEVSIGADGRICLAGPTLFSGYRLRPDLTDAALESGRFVTEDLGRLTADVRLEVFGRADDVVITGGVNVPAGLVSRVVGDHPQVRACVVLGVPDQQWGQRLVAVIEPVDPDAPPSLDAIRSFASSRLESAALPVELVPVAALPMLASGKPDRAKIARIAADHRQPQER